jgi:hypothetical protein
MNDIAAPRQQQPLVFLEFDHVLVTDCRYIHQFHFLPLLYRLNIGVDTDIMRPLWPKLVPCKVRTNLRRLHDEFQPRYVISSGMAGVMNKVRMLDMLRRAGLALVADHLHGAWCIEPGEDATRGARIAAWLGRWRAGGQSFVVLDNVETGRALARGALAHRTVICPSERGLTTPALARARAILHGQPAGPRSDRGDHQSLAA